MMNKTQENMMIATFDYIFDTITNSCTPEMAIIALQCITDAELYEQYKERFAELDVTDVIEKAREIYHHPCPQNRTTGSPYITQNRPGEVGFFQGRHGEGLTWEKIGLLNLTGFNDNTAAPITRRDVIQFMEVLIQAQLAKHQAALIAILNIQNTDYATEIREKNTIQQDEEVNLIERLEELSLEKEDLQQQINNLSKQNKFLVENYEKLAENAVLLTEENKRLKTFENPSTIGEPLSNASNPHGMFAPANHTNVTLEETPRDDIAGPICNLF